MFQNFPFLHCFKFFAAQADSQLRLVYWPRSYCPSFVDVAKANLVRGQKGGSLPPS